MLKPKGTLVLSVNYTIDEHSKTVRIDHPSLSGAMGFEYSTEDLAEAQLEAIRIDKTKSQLEELLDDTSELIEIAGKLKASLKDLRGK